MKPAPPTAPSAEVPQKKRGERNEAARKLREAEALRENLRRRKAQLRARGPGRPAQD